MKQAKKVLYNKDKTHQIPKEIVEEFREIYETEYGIKLTSKEASDKVRKMLRLFNLLSKAQYFVDKMYNII